MESGLMTVKGITAYLRLSDCAGFSVGDTHGDLFADDIVAETTRAGVEAGENKEAHT
jgi:hypothetical protein